MKTKEFKKFFLRKISWIINYLYTGTRSEELVCIEDKLKNYKSDLLIMSIVFNNFDLLKKQYKNIKKHADLMLIIVDNSSDRLIRIKNREFCVKNNVGYVGLPFNIFSGIDNSMSHSLALNWAIKNIILKYKIKYFGFIDSDIFPVGKMNILPKIKKNKGFYGLYQERDKKWYLWPGYCFFDKSLALKSNLNFLPCNGMDTGGRNYYNLFYKINMKKCIFPSQTYRQITNKKTNDFRDTHIEIIDKVWIHLMNSSNTYKNKIKYLKNEW